MSWKRSLGRVAARVVQGAAWLSAGTERALSPRELQLLSPIYGACVALERVRLVEGVRGPANLSGRVFCIEDRLFVPPPSVPLPDGVLVHEICHVWQWQHGAHAYIADSIVAQTVGDGYALEKGLLEGRSWARLNCEQQATLIEEAWAQGCFAGRPFIIRGRRYDAVFTEAVHQLRAGLGAEF
jgi:hypothetical protein